MERKGFKALPELEWYSEKTDKYSLAQKKI